MSLYCERINSALSRLACVPGKSHRLNHLTVILFGFGLTALTMTGCIPKSNELPESNEVYFDDTHMILSDDIDIEVVKGNFGYDSYKFSESTNGEQLALDARNASFIVANSKNPNPSDDFDCDMGSNPINRYPFKVYGADNTWVVGGIINGEIPQESDWSPTYCNSGAVIFKRAENATVDGIRITGAWDGIRPSDNSKGLTIRNSWLSNVRDDAVENDDFLPLIFEDNLVDGAFQGISVRSNKGISTQSEETIYVYGNVIRIREYLYKGRQQYGALFKNQDSSPSSVIHNTIVAVDYNDGRTFKGYWEKSWSKIEECSNNLFLWLSDLPIPSEVYTPPACFTVLTGAEARAEWVRAKQNWIDCHPNVARTHNDPISNPEQCVANTFGGYSRYEAEAPNVEIDDVEIDDVEIDDVENPDPSTSTEVVIQD